MKIAYIVLAHKYPEQLVRLISKLNTNDVSFFIHIDKKVNRNIYSQIVTQLKDFPNVSFIKRYNSPWGSFNLVRATLEAIKSIVETGTPFDYVVYLSGQDYPIKSNKRINEFFQENQGKEFLEYFTLPHAVWKGDGFRRVEYWHIYWNNEWFCIPEKREFKSPLNSYLYSFLTLLLPNKRPQFTKKFPLYGGSTFWCLTEECAKWVNDFVKQNPNFVNRFNYTYITDEVFFQTLLLSSPFKDKIVNNNLKYIEWGKVDAINPRVLEKEDFEKISKSEKLFARKFDISIDAEILDMIDKNILSE